MYDKKGLHTQVRIDQKLQDEGGSLLKRNWIPLPSLLLYTPRVNFLVSWNQISWGSSIKSHAYCLAQKTLHLLETDSDD